MDLRQQLILEDGGMVFILHTGPAARRSGPVTGPMYVTGPGVTAQAEATPLVLKLHQTSRDAGRGELRRSWLSVTQALLLEDTLSVL
jgi:hypothetical protein